MPRFTSTLGWAGSDRNQDAGATNSRQTMDGGCGTGCSRERGGQGRDCNGDSSAAVGRLPKSRLRGAQLFELNSGVNECSLANIFLDRSQKSAKFKKKEMEMSASVHAFIRCLTYEKAPAPNPRRASVAAKAAAAPGAAHHFRWRCTATRAGASAELRSSWNIQGAVPFHGTPHRSISSAFLSRCVWARPHRL